MTEQGSSRVFISYSHDTIEHQERVLGLADRLRADGIDAEIDQYNAAPPDGWPLWCERQIEAADVVLMICTEAYLRRVKGDEERGKGLGVVWEARIIRQLIYDAGTVSDKFVPILFSDAQPEQIPTTIRGWTHYVIDTEDGYEAPLSAPHGAAPFATASTRNDSPAAHPHAAVGRPTCALGHERQGRYGQHRPQFSQGFCGPERTA